MPTPPDDSTGHALRQAFMHATGREPAPAEAEFIAQAARDRSPGDLDRLTPEAFAGQALELWRFAGSRDPARPALRVRFIDQPRAAVLEIVQKDAPFLVASVMGEVTAQGGEVLGMIHPVVELDDGRWSFIQAILSPPADTDALAEGVRAALADVWAAVGDFEPMMAALRQAIAALERSGRASAEELSFLKWLNEGRFVMLGARSYRYPAEPGDAPEAVEGSSLGVLRDPARQVLRQGNEPAVRAALARRRSGGHAAVTVAKSNLKSRVHRRVHMDYVGVEQFDAQGQAVGEMRFVGLFTAEAYSLPVDQTPLIRAKTRAVFERAHLPEGGHSASRLRNVLNSWPRDDLFQIGEDELLAGAMLALRLQDRPRVDLFVRRDPFERFASVLVYVPRERYDYEFVGDAGRLLADRFGGRVSAAYPEFNDAPLARVHYIIGFDPGDRREPELEDLRRELADLARTWSDRLIKAASARLGRDERRRLAAMFEASPAGYQAANSTADALADFEAAGRLDGRADLEVRMFRRRGDGRERARFKLYAKGAPPALADVVPILEHLGLKAVREEGFALGRELHVHEYLVEDRAGGAIPLEEVRETFEETVEAIWDGRTESDGFNRLVVSLGVSWREAALVRALTRHRQQSGLDPSQAVQEQALADNPQIARAILDLFAVRFDPGLDLDLAARQARAEEIWGEIQAALQKVAALDADRVLRRLALLVRACVRTNYYQRGADGEPKPYIAFKVASRELADLPAPKPFREIFVSAPNVDGVHLRFGPIARGGLRWSDRRDDFRTEVLGLAKAQQVKNAVIVPVGSKGGFFPKRLPKDGGAEAVREEAVRAYKTFLRGLLDITDNLRPDGAVSHPPQVVVHDGDDPYLVVAADKGTASFSDIANEVAESYGFWLGDAFASGGSAGYDHKEMGITARGAWEAVKRHFREMGKDIQAEPFTCIGVGDMSGDVFGNGMLLSDKTRLVAAFDHRHVFLDPDPDPAASFAERRRLFELPRSSWDDYDRKLISEGGGVFPRTAKTVALTPQVKALLEVEADEMAPSDLIRAILKAKVELLYLGGIGTYVKAAAESHADVGDKANDAVRINAADLRCQVVGEGANLGFTQAARIEYALAGGRIDTDAIDNSAGVDSSDHEVNIKILTGAAERAGRLSRPDRNALLASMTEDVAAKVLAHNYDQTLALSLLEAEAAQDLEAQAQFMSELEAKGRLDRVVEGLPDAKTIAARAAAGRGLTRPELSVLLAYGKLDLFDDTVASDAPDDPYFEATLRGYFPEPLAKFEAEMGAHRLRREIIATVVGNDIVNRCGPTFPSRLRAAADCDTSALVKAFAAARAILDLDALWREVEGLDGKAPAAAQIALFRELAYVQRGQTFWLARSQAKAPQPVQALIDRHRPAVQALRGVDVLSSIEREGAQARVGRLIEAGAPEELAQTVGRLRHFTTVGHLVDLSQACRWPVEAVARVYHRAGGEFGFDAVRAGAGTLRAGDAFERTAVRRLLEDLLAEQTRLASSLFQQAGEDPVDSDEAAAALIEAFRREHADVVAKTEAVIKEIEAADGGWTFAKLTIANAALRELSKV